MELLTQRPTLAEWLSRLSTLPSIRSNRDKHDTPRHSRHDGSFDRLCFSTLFTLHARAYHPPLAIDYRQISTSIAIIKLFTCPLNFQDRIWTLAWTAPGEAPFRDDASEESNTQSRQLRMDGIHVAIDIQKEMRAVSCQWQMEEEETQRKM